MYLLIFVLTLVVFIPLAIDGFDFHRLLRRMKKEWTEMPIWMPVFTLALILLAIVLTGKTPHQ